MGKIIQINEYPRPDYRNGNSLAFGRRGCRCAPALDRQSFIQNEIRALKTARTQSNVVSLEDFLERPGYPQQFWDLIHSADLLAALPDVAARQIIRAAAYRLSPGGHLLLANPALESKARLCTNCGGAGIVYRTEFEMAALTRPLLADHFSGQAVFSGTSGDNVYLELYRLPQTGRTFCPKLAA